MFPALLQNKRTGRSRGRAEVIAAGGAIDKGHVCRVGGNEVTEIGVLEHDRFGRLGEAVETERDEAGDQPEHSQYEHDCEREGSNNGRQAWCPGGRRENSPRSLARSGPPAGTRARPA